jgi:hypothetical protein
MKRRDGLRTRWSSAYTSAILLAGGAKWKLSMSTRQFWSCSAQRFCSPRPGLLRSCSSGSALYRCGCENIGGAPERRRRVPQRTEDGRPASPRPCAEIQDRALTEEMNLR